MNERKKHYSFAEMAEDTFTLLETQFKQLQASKGFFAFELFLSAYLLINLAIVAERFMMPALMTISS